MVILIQITNKLTVSRGKNRSPADVWVKVVDVVLTVHGKDRWILTPRSCCVQSTSVVSTSLMSIGIAIPWSMPYCRGMAETWHRSMICDYSSFNLIMSHNKDFMSAEWCTSSGKWFISGNCRDKNGKYQIYLPEAFAINYDDDIDRCLSRLITDLDINYFGHKEYSSTEHKYPFDKTP